MKISELRPSEQRVVRLLSQGYTRAKISTELGIRLHTLDAHLHNIRGRAGTARTLGILLHFFELVEK